MKLLWMKTSFNTQSHLHAGPVSVGASKNLRTGERAPSILKHTGGAKGTERQLSVFKYG